MSTRHRKHLGQALALTAALGLALSACSGGGSEPSEPENQNTNDAASDTPVVADVSTINPGTLTVCSDYKGGEPPMYMADENGDPVGAEIDLAEAVAHNMGLDMEVVGVKFASIIPALQAEQCDTIMASLYIKPEREEIVDFVPYMLSGSSVLVHKGNPAGITGMDESICGKKVVIQLGTTAEEQSKEQSKECKSAGLDPLNIVTTDQLTTAIQMVQTDQTDAYAGTSTSVAYYLGLVPDDVELVGDQFGAIEVGAAVDKGNTELQEAIRAALIQTQEDGTYDRIFAEYNVSNMALPVPTS